MILEELEYDWLLDEDQPMRNSLLFQKAVIVDGSWMHQETSTASGFQ